MQGAVNREDSAIYKGRHAYRSSWIQAPKEKQIGRWQYQQQWELHNLCNNQNGIKVVSMGILPVKVRHFHLGNEMQY